jgi:putative DNA primase/helicase
MQRLCGYFLTGRTDEDVFVIAHGDGANGKTTLVETIKDVMGDYAHTTDPELLLQSNRNPGPELMQLFGKRLAASEETNQGRKLNEAMVKNVTGGGVVHGRGLYERPWDFMPTHKLLLDTNHKPKIDGTDEGIRRRIHLIPFYRTFQKPEQDPRLQEKLAIEQSGILNWMLQGCADWQALEGLYPPPSVVDATNEYLEENDEMRRFIRDRGNVGDAFKDARTPSGDLYREYQLWAGEEGIEVDRRLTQTVFGKALEKLGYPEERQWNPDVKQTLRYRRGINLKGVSR